MRVAPVGLFAWRLRQQDSPHDAFRLGAELAALTHGHPTGALTGGVLAVLILALTDGASLPEALVASKAILRSEPGHEETLRAIEQQLPDFATLASNTSSIPLAQLAEVLDRPSQFIGLHFFNPVPASTLIEIVVHGEASDALAEKARGWVRALGKTPITVSDSPGFASSRLGVAIALEAIRMVEEGVASPADIDLAMELGYKHPSGPLKTTDIVGLDVRLGIAEQLEHDLGPRFAPPQLLRDMVAEGKLGRKSGKGFYDWNNGE